MKRIEVGTILYGYCGGAFGRDSYDDKRVEAIGSDWIVARDIGYRGEVRFTTFESLEELVPFTIEIPEHEF